MYKDKGDIYMTYECFQNDLEVNVKIEMKEKIKERWKNKAPKKNKNKNKQQYVQKKHNTQNKNLYKSTSNLIPSKREWIIKHTAEATPKNKKYLFLLKSLLIVCINLLFACQYLINKIAVMNIPGLNIRYAGNVLAVLLIETLPSM